MKRKDFLKGAGLAGLGLALPNVKLSGKTSKTANEELGGSCELIPSETAGPFPLDLTENSTFFRQDIREGLPGVLLTLRLKVLGVDNCEPMQNVRVNIWHCTAEGIYSGYNTNNNPGTADSTYFRGYQFTDSNGEVEFTTIFPGWYRGRICHIHFQVHVSSSYAAVSQLTFPIDTKNAIYAANPSIYPDGADPLNFNTDMVFSDGHQYQLATLEADPDTGGYKSYMEISVQGSGTSGVGHIERETAKVFELGQNYPNPYRVQTTVPLHLKQSANVKLELWDLSGRKVATVLNERKSAGQYNIEIDPSQYGLPSANYIYQVETSNSYGTFRMPKMMTVHR